MRIQEQAKRHSKVRVEKRRRRRRRKKKRKKRCKKKGRVERECTK